MSFIPVSCVPVLGAVTIDGGSVASVSANFGGFVATA